MAAKQRRSGKKRKPIRLNQEPEESVKLISEHELLEREQKYMQRLHDVGISKHFIDVGLREHEQLMEAQVSVDRWNRYLNCDGLPKPHCPQDVRLFMERLRYHENASIDNTVDWTLAVDQRSILTQDVFGKDLTRKTLRREMCPNLGANYDVQISSYLATLDLIEHLLDNEAELSLLDLTQSKEIVASKTELENEICEAFDRFTYRIVSAMDAYMTTIDGIETNYFYKGKDFDMHIWALRDVPIRFEQMQLPFMIAKMECVGIEIQMPLSCLSHHLTLRCVHSFFDPLTPNAKSFQQVITKPTEEIIPGITDIEEALISEWVMQIQLMEETRSKMVQNRINYEETVKDFEAKVAVAGKRPKGSVPNKNSAEKIKIPKPPKEVPTIDENMFPDIQSLFLEKEKEQFDDFLDEFYHPDVLHLKPGEINLKKYIMLGGTYNLCYVQGPKYTEFETFTVTNHVEGRKLNVLKEIVADLKYLDSSLENKPSQFQLIPNEELNIIPISMELDELPYFLVTFELPRHLCMWGVPIVCQYEECELEETTNLRQLASGMLSRFQDKAKSYIKAESIFQKDHDEDDQYYQEDDPSLNIKLESPKLSMKRITESRATRASSNIYRSPLPVLLRFADLPTSKWDDVAITNFNLESKLSKSQIGNLQRYCMPRIISSFKFPMEMNEEITVELAERQAQRRKPSLFKRRLESNIEDDSTIDVILDGDFNYEQQTNPERVFPIFPKNKYTNYDFLDCDTDEPNTICNLLHKFDGIRSKYINNNKKILDQKPFGFIEKKERKQPAVAVELTTSRTTSQTRLIEPKRIGSVRKLKSIRSDSSKAASKPTSQTKITEPKKNVSVRKLKSTKSNISKTVSVESDNWSTSSKYKYRKMEPIELLDTDAISVVSKFSESILSANIQIEDKTVVKSHHWTSEHIVKSTLNPANLSITVQTDRLGIFGFAYKRYEHFPFRNWSLEPHNEKPNELVFTLDTFHVRVILNITKEGFTGYITDLVTTFVAKPVKYLTIEAPITEFKELKKRFLEKNVNIFSEHDAPFYIENGYFSVKHLSTEYHIYETIALHCFLLKFYHSGWNRLATRRNLVLCLKDPKEKDENYAVTVRVTPEDATFVEITEHCSDNLNVFILDYKPTWRNINHYSDLHHLINSMYPAATDNRNRDPKMLSYVYTLFNELRPLSYS